jgi:hypothetical protein
MAARTLRRRCNCSTHAPCTLPHAYPFSIFRSSLLILRACSHSIWHERETPQSLRDEGRPISGMQERGAAVHPRRWAAATLPPHRRGTPAGALADPGRCQQHPDGARVRDGGAPFQPGVREVRFGESLPRAGATRFAPNSRHRSSAGCCVLACDVYGRRGRESRRGLDVCTMMPP